VTPAELEAELARGALRPAYLVAGAEALLRDTALRALRAAVLDPAARDFNHDRLDGESATPAQLLDALGTLPVAASRRLVELREPEARRGGKALVEALAEALPGLQAQQQTILAVSAVRVDRRARWVKAFGEPAALVACDPPRGARALLGFVAAEARRAGVALEPGAAEALVEAVGPQLLALRSELEKAALHAGVGRAVSKADVMATASVLAEEPIWELSDAIGEGRIPDALVVLRRLLAAGSAPQMLLGSLANHFRKLLRTRAGAPPPGHPFAVRKLEQQARRYTKARLRACFDALHEVDEILKGQGSVAPEVALERLVIGLAA
jgi:DNA polymerase III subunit delta